MMLDLEKKKFNIAVLYVEDDDVIRNSLKQILSRKFNRILTASTGIEGLEIFNNEKIELLITDIQMPVMNGLEMVRKIRSVDMRMPVIITTAFDDTKYMIEAIELGVNGFVQKPVNIPYFWQTIDTAVGIIALERELEQKNKLLNEYKNAIDSSGIVSKTDIYGIITYVNDQFVKTTGFSREELIGQTHRLIRHPNTPASTYRDMWETIVSKRIWKGILEIRAKNGEEYYLDSCIVPILDPSGEISEFISIRYEITEIIRQQRLLNELYTDKLTGFPNREKLLNDISTEDNIYLFLLNLDSFKEINDLYGSKTGDAVLLEFSKRLKNSMSEVDGKIFRLQSDEFALIIQKNDGFRDPEKFALFLREDICESLFVFSELQFHLSFTVGIAYIDDMSSPEGGKIIQYADMALKTAKKTQKPVLLYHDSLKINKEYENNIIWTTKVRYAIKDDRIVPFFQPIINNKTGKIDKYETLARLLDEDKKFISPLQFIEIAQRTGFYENITKMMVRKSFDFFKDHDFEFSMNLSALDFRNPATLSYIIDVLKKNPELSKKAVFEILESEGIENYSDVKNFIDEVKQFGCKIAIDDFGSGYSNFSYIIKLKIDYLKIDSSIISLIAEDRTSQIVARNIVNVAAELGVKTIAEYVSSKEIFDKVLEIGIDFSQGYYFGAPSEKIFI